MIRRTQQPLKNKHKLSVEISFVHLEMSTEDYRPDYDVIIVGAGLTGLVAAQQILRKEKTLKVLVLESENRVGGQVYSTDFGELGAKWIQSSHKHIVNLCMALDFELRPLEKPKLHHEMTWSLQNVMQRDFWVLWELNMFIKKLDVLSENCGVIRLDHKNNYLTFSYH
jgi:NAD(P)-binding Rossmann-like domain